MWDTNIEGGEGSVSFVVCKVTEAYSIQHKASLQLFQPVPNAAVQGAYPARVRACRKRADLSELS